MPGRARNSSHEQVSHPPHRYCQSMSCDTTGQQAASCKAHSSPTGHLLDLGRCAELVGSWLPPVQTVSCGLRRTAASAHAGGPPDRDQQQLRMERCWPAKREHFAAFLHAVELDRLSSTCHFSLLLAPVARESVVFSSLVRFVAIAAVGVAEDLQEQLMRAAGTRAARDLLLRARERESFGACLVLLLSPVPLLISCFLPPCSHRTTRLRSGKGHIFYGRYSSSSGWRNSGWQYKQWDTEHYSERKEEWHCTGCGEENFLVPQKKDQRRVRAPRGLQGDLALEDESRDTGYSQHWRKLWMKEASQSPRDKWKNEAERPQ